MTRFVMTVLPITNTVLQASYDYTKRTKATPQSGAEVRSNESLRLGVDEGR